MVMGEVHSLLWRTRDFLAMLVKRVASSFDRRPINKFVVELFDCDKIVIHECENVNKGGVNRSRTIEIAAIDAVGYVTYESNPWLYDYFLLINSKDVTYMMPIEWPRVEAVIGFLEKNLPGYKGHIGIANSTHFTSLAVWPPSLAGGKFPLMANVFPPMFASGIN